MEFIIKILQWEYTGTSEIIQTIAPAIVAGIAALGSALIGTAGTGRKKWQRKIDYQTDAQSKLNKEAAASEYQYGEQAAENQFGREIQAFEMENKYNSPKEQVQRLKDANLNVGLMMSGAGGSGGEGSMGSAESGGGANVQAANVADATTAESARQHAKIQGLQAATQIAQMVAQTKLMEKQGENIEADTKTKEQDVEIKKQTIENLKEDLNRTIAETNNTRIETEGRKLQNAIQEVDLEVKKSTKEWEIQTVHEEMHNVMTRTNRMYDEISKLRRENRIGDETEEETKEIIKNQLTLLITEIAEKEMGIELNEAEVREIQKEIDNYGEKLPPWTQLYNNVSHLPFMKKGNEKTDYK